jgi:signal peptidase II
MLCLFASGGLLLLLDQWSKRTVQVHVRGRSISWGPVLRIRCVASLKAIYRRDGARVALVLVWVMALISAILLHRSGAWFQSRAAQIGLGLAFGGATGNLLDILRWRYVVDFIDLRWWPVFNLADAAIISGLVVALWPHI